MPSPKLVAIISKPQKPELSGILPELISWLGGHGCEYVLDLESAAYLDGAEAVVREEMPQRQPQLVIVLGGDGTLLSAARAFARMNTPILAVNLGSLGFLTEIPISDMYATLDAWHENRAQVESREMMRAELRRDGELFREWDVLNDVVVSKGAIARMADFRVTIDEQFVAAYRADGIIVSTPTGSTAYNLAAAGPIMMPSVHAMVVTPICPHLLTIRPIVVPGDLTITIDIEGVPNEIYLTVDGQEAISLQLGDQVSCCRSPYSVRLLRLRPNGLFSVLRSKLKWGER
jgi:NAD+ kinase